MKNQKIILLINFIFAWTFFLIASCQILENDAIPINRRTFFQGNESLQLDSFQFLNINSLMAETIKKQFSKTKFS